MSTVTVSEICFPGSKQIDKLKSRLTLLLRQGVRPRRLALAIALGATIGLLPTVWGTSVLCFLAAWLLRLNPVVVQAANYLVYPLQILLFVPYLRLGERLFGGNSSPPDLDRFMVALRTTPLQGLEQCWQTNFRALSAWLLCEPLLLGGCYLFALLVLKRLHRPEPGR